MSERATVRCQCGWIGEWDVPGDVTFDDPRVRALADEHITSDFHRNGMELRAHLRQHVFWPTESELNDLDEGADPDHEG